MTAPPGFTPPPGNPRFPLVDPLRAVAALAVVVFHFSQFSGLIAHGAVGRLSAALDSGVTLFFVISGFLLYRPLARARWTGTPTSVRGYAKSRLLRILPAYWLALGVLALWPGLGFPGGAWRYAGFLQVYSPDSTRAGLPVAWSLCVEMTFYVFLPVYGVLAWRWLARLPAVPAMVLDTTVVATLAAASVVLRTAFDDPRHRYLQDTILGTFDWFAIGMVIAIASVGVELGAATPAVRRLARAPILPCLAGAAACLVLAAAAKGSFRPGTPVYGGATSVHLLYGIAAGLIVWPAAFRTGTAPSPRALARLGVISYGIYLWHYPLLDRVHDLDVARPARSCLFLAAAAGAIACAALSYRLVERPLLARKPRRR